MIRQDNYELKIISDLPFEKYACKLFCCFYFSEQIKNISYDPEAIVDKTLRLINEGWADCELGIYGVENTKMVLDYLEVPVKAVKTASASYECKENELEILKLTKPGYMHFVPGDGKGHYTWDPLGIRPWQREYELSEKRIIVLKENWYG